MMTKKMSRYSRLVYLFVSLCMCAASVFAQQDSRHLTLNDLLSVEPIGDTALSPDGKTIALVRDGQISLLPSEGGWPVLLTSSPGGKSGLNWSSDSSKLAYVSGGSIWSVNAEGGQPHRLTRALPGEGDPRQSGDRAPQWSPKGRWILFETGRRGHNTLSVVSEDGANERYLDESSNDDVSPAWSPDGLHISYTERSEKHFSGELKRMDFDPKTALTSDPVTLYTSPTDRGGGWSISKAAWSPDSRSLAVVLQDSGWDHIYLIGADGGSPRALTEGEFEDRDPVFSPDGRELAVISNRNNLEAARIWIVPIDKSSPRPLASFPVPGVESSPEWSADGQKIFFHRTSPVESTDVWVANVRGRPEARSITNTLPRNLNGVLQVPQKITFSSKDGLAISGLLYKPSGGKAGDTHPGVLWIHGGPEGQDKFRLDLWAQYLAEQGYVVLEPNYRGSSGYGEKFRNLNVEDSGGGEVEDVAAGAQYLVDKHLADPKRLAIGGGSHGGTMVAYAVTMFPKLFRAGIEMYGVVDRATFIERTNHNSAVRWMIKMGGSPAEKPEVYQRANSLARVAAIEAPLLILHGENDPQVPPYESAQFVRALKEHHKVFYYYTYPNELHGFTQREHRLDAWRKELAFLERYIQPRYGVSSTSTDDLGQPSSEAASRTSEPWD